MGSPVLAASDRKLTGPHYSVARKKGSSFDKGKYLMDHEGYEKPTDEQAKAVRGVLASQPDAELLAEMLGVAA